MMAPREVLLRALALIEIGWTRGRYKKMRGDRACYCITGALRAVETGGGLVVSDSDAYNFLARVIQPFHPSGVVIWKWNDQKGRTKSQVIAVMKQAINLAAIKVMEK